MARCIIGDEISRSHEEEQTMQVSIAVPPDRAEHS
jgi:hypothetical protein